MKYLYNWREGAISWNIARESAPELPAHSGDLQTRNTNNGRAGRWTMLRLLSGQSVSKPRQILLSYQIPHSNNQQGDTYTIYLHRYTGTWIY